MKIVRWAVAAVAAVLLVWPSAVAAQDTPGGTASAATKRAATTSPATSPDDQGTRTASKPTVKAPENVGFARIDPGWPSWLTVSVGDRMRVDSVPLPGALGAGYDAYFLNRFRLLAAARCSTWAQVTAQVQDARVRAYHVAVPASVQHAADIRLAYVELGRKRPRGVTAIVGRQELMLGDGRMVWSPDWGNVGRTYDAVRFSAFVPGFRLDVVGAAPVDVASALGRPKYGERLLAVWGSFDRVKPLGSFDVYELVKNNHTALGEAGSKGDQRIYATGFRVGAPITRTLALDAEYNFETGHSAADGVAAWAFHDGLTWAITSSGWKPRLGVEYDFASGDDNPKDGRKQTFDPMYATTHAKWGLADLLGWRNMHHAAVKLEFSPTRRLKISTAINKQALATVMDGWYGVSGVKLVTNRAATSRDLGWEPDLYGTYTVTRDVTVGAGYAVLFGGDFVRQSTKVTRVRTPYLMWTMKF